MSTDLPMISSERYPKMRSAAAFQLVIIPFRSFETMASSDDSTMAANSRSGSIILGASCPVELVGWLASAS